jgi:hypothetical protein
MAKVIIYPKMGGGVCSIHPVTGDLTIHQIAAKDVPLGTPYNIIDDAIIPKDIQSRESWEYDFSKPDGVGVKVVQLPEKFWNQVYYPAQRLLLTLAEHPYAVEPDSNVLLHQFEGLALHVNHFTEKHDLGLKFADEFRDLADSIKHICRKPERQIDIQSSVLFEINANNQFRFIRNTIEAKYRNSKKKFDAIEKLNETIAIYLPHLGLNKLQVPESQYPFYPWAFTFHREDLSAVTRGVDLHFVKKIYDQYVSVDPEKFEFFGLDSSRIGQDPRTYLPS